MARSWLFFQPHLEYIAAITRALNNIPSNEDFCVHVELREADTHKKVGAWSDEIAHGDWYFDPSDNDNKES